MTHRSKPDKLPVPSLVFMLTEVLRAALVDIRRELVHALPLLSDFITCGNDGVRHTP